MLKLFGEHMRKPYTFIRAACILLVLLCGMTLLLLEPEKTPKPLSMETGDRCVQNVSVEEYRVTGVNRQCYVGVPERVVSVGENITETLVALGVQDRIIRAYRYGNPYYMPEPEYEEVYRQIDFRPVSEINVERILMTEPDLIVAGQSLFVRNKLRGTSFWHKRGVHTFLPINANSPSSMRNPETLENELGFIRDLGVIFKKEKRADEFVSRIRKLVQGVRERAATLPVRRVMILEQLGKGIVSYDSRKLVGDMCVQLGAEIPNGSTVTISREWILQEDPDVIFIVKSGGDPEQAVQEFCRLPGMNNLKAVQSGRVYGIMLNYTYNSAIKTEAGIRQLAYGIYPELSEDLYKTQ